MVPLIPTRIVGSVGLSAEQTAYRLALLNGDVLGMAGPGEKIAAFLACPKMYEGDLADQALDRRKSPQWQRECTKLVCAWPTDEKLWDEYRRIRDESLRQDHEGRNDDMGGYGGKVYALPHEKAEAVRSLLGARPR